MNYGIILAGGNGTRINGYDVPKQFIKLTDVEMIFYPINTFVMTKYVDKVVVVTNKEYLKQTKELVNKFFPGNESISIITGGKSRNESLHNAFKHLRDKLKARDDDIILTHDAARIFVTEKIIKDAIAVAKKSQCVANPSIPLNDSLCQSNDKKEISVPKREDFSLSQTPQTIQFKLLKKIFNNKYDKTLFENCDLCKLAEINKIKIIPSLGSKLNFKVTDNNDLLIAKLLASIL